MKNIDRIRKMGVEELAKIIADDTCKYCSCKPYRDCDFKCINEVSNWLEQEYIEPMPELEAGDIVVYGGLSYVAISSTTLVCRETEKQYRLEDINSKVKNIQRYNGSTYQCIWRADNDR